MVNSGNTSEEKFDLIDQKLLSNYNDILNNMRIVREMIVLDPENSNLKNLLYSLAEAATKIIGTHIAFAYTYENENEIMDYIDRLNQKKQELLSEVATDLSYFDNKKRGR